MGKRSMASEQRELQAARIRGSSAPPEAKAISFEMRTQTLLAGGMFIYGTNIRCKASGSGSHPLARIVQCASAAGADGSALLRGSLALLAQLGHASEVGSERQRICIEHAERLSHAHASLGEGATPAAAPTDVAAALWEARAAAVQLLCERMPR